MNVLRYQAPALLWACIIFISSSIPGTSPIFKVLFGHDKIVHTIVYCGLAYLTFRALYHQSRLPSVSRHAVLLSMAFTLFYAATDELHQLFVPRRSADLRDFLADAAGALLSLVLLAILQFTRKRRELRSQS